MDPALEKELREHLERLAPEGQREVLAYARALAIRGSGSPENLARFAGTMDPLDLAAMSAAIETGCDQIDVACFSSPKRSSRIEAIAKEVAALSDEDIATFRATFRAWFAEFDAAAWDRQIEQDSHLGELDALVEEALRERNVGK